jgi:putative glutamine amidotransferase
MLKYSFTFTFTLLLASVSWAQIRLVEWHTANTLAPFILPVREGETPQQASLRYLKNLSKDPGLMELFQGEVPHMETIEFKELSEQNVEKRGLLVTNKTEDYTKNSHRTTQFKKLLAMNQHDAYLFPMGWGLGLTLKEKREIAQQVRKQFRLLISMGGSDVTTSTYKQEDFHARATIESRDLDEIELIKNYVTDSKNEKNESEKGFFLGICRGSQIASVAMGYKLIQDLPFHVGEQVAHADDWHDIQLRPTTNKILQSVNPQSAKLHVNSLHHQSVIFRPNGPLELAAVSEDGIVEATEFKNGRGLLLQFHPELMENTLGERIFAQIIRAKKAVTSARCSRIFGT